MEPQDWMSPHRHGHVWVVFLIQERQRRGGAHSTSGGSLGQNRLREDGRAPGQAPCLNIRFLPDEYDRFQSSVSWRCVDTGCHGSTPSPSGQRILCPCEDAVRFSAEALGARGTAQKVPVSQQEEGHVRFTSVFLGPGLARSRCSKDVTGTHFSVHPKGE